MAKKVKPAYERTEFIRMTKDIDVYRIADMLMLRKPVIVNFEDYNVIESNRVIMFLSGVIYALDGNVEIIREKILAFATKEDLRDKTLRKVISEYKE